MSGAQALLDAFTTIYNTRPLARFPAAPATAPLAPTTAFRTDIGKSGVVHSATPGSSTTSA